MKNETDVSKVFILADYSPLVKKMPMGNNSPRILNIPFSKNGTDWLHSFFEAAIESLKR